MDMNSPPPCPNTVTLRRNPHRKARATPATTNAPRRFEPLESKLRGISLFPDEETFSRHAPEKAPSELCTLKKSADEYIKVFLRIRPLVLAKGYAIADQAQRLRAKNVWPKNPTKKNAVGGGKKKSSGICVAVNDFESVTLITSKEMHESKKIKSETYGGFSYVFPSDSSQFDVYAKMLKPMVEDFLGGKSGLLAALGPSGSGKTHTVFGCPRQPGMVPLALRHIFEETELKGNRAAGSFYISMFEIYSERGKAEKLFNLLPDGGELSMQQSTVKGLQEVLISSAGQAESLVAEALLKRATARTNTNSQSSRSQCIINIHYVPQKCEGVVNARLNSTSLTIIDLAGAEREKKTGNQGARLLESNFINNTLMVFGLCLRSLLEHQKNPKKPLQKHFQYSMLTRYLRDYLEGKKRMTLILTAKSGEEDYLDTSYLLRQAAPYMKIKYNEVEQSNIIPNKRQYQVSSVIDHAKPSSTSVNAKRMRLHSSEDSMIEEKSIGERHISKEEASSNCKFAAKNCAPLDSECDSEGQSERNHIIMQNFAKAVWSVLKQYNAKLKVAEMEIQSLRESVGCEKKRCQALETELNEFRASCTCCRGGKGKSDFELKLDAHDSKNACETTPDCQCSSPKSSECISTSQNFDKSNLAQLHSWGNLCLAKDKVVDSVPSKISCVDSKLKSAETLRSCDGGLVNGFGVCGENLQNSQAKDKAVDSDPSKITCVDKKLKSEDTVRSHDGGLANVFGVCGENLRNSQIAESFLATDFCTKDIVKSEDDQINDRYTNHNTDIIVSLQSCSATRDDNSSSVELDQPHSWEQEQSSGAKASPELRLDQSDEETRLGISCTQLDAEKSDRRVCASLSKPGDYNALEIEVGSKIPTELFVSPLLLKDEKLEASSSKDKACDLDNIQRPKRRLMPSSSILVRDLSTLDLVDETEKSKGSRGTRKLAAEDMKRTNGSISLLRLLKSIHE